MVPPPCFGGECDLKTRVQHLIELKVVEKSDRGKDGWQERARKATHRNTGRVTRVGRFGIRSYKKTGRRSVGLGNSRAMDLSDGGTLKRERGESGRGIGRSSDAAEVYPDVVVVVLGLPEGMCSCEHDTYH